MIPFWEEMKKRKWNSDIKTQENPGSKWQNQDVTPGPSVTGSCAFSAMTHALHGWEEGKVGPREAD